MRYWISPQGGTKEDSSRYLIEEQRSGKFLFPVKAMSTIFKRIFLQSLRQYLEDEGIEHDEITSSPSALTNWVVYAKPYISSTHTSGPEALLRYLARYTHNIAISHHRIVRYDKSSVTFSYTDYRHQNQRKLMTLPTWEFVRRFIMHILPKRFVRIRHYGILSSAYKNMLFPEKVKSPPN